MFSVNSQIQQAEVERESEFTLMFDVMRKLVQALEDKTSNDLIQLHYPQTEREMPMGMQQNDSSMVGSYSARKNDHRRTVLTRKGSLPG